MDLCKAVIASLSGMRTLDRFLIERIKGFVAALAIMAVMGIIGFTALLP